MSLFLLLAWEENPRRRGQAAIMHGVTTFVIAIILVAIILVAIILVAMILVAMIIVGFILI